MIHTTIFSCFWKKVEQCLKNLLEKYVYQTKTVSEKNKMVPQQQYKLMAWIASKHCTSWRIASASLFNWNRKQIVLFGWPLFQNSKTKRNDWMKFNLFDCIIISTIYRLIFDPHQHQLPVCLIPPETIILFSACSASFPR